MRYLHPAVLATVRQLAEDRMPWRRPRRAARVRGFLVGRHRRGPSIDVLYRALAGLRQLEVVAA
ncbi:hypothetical protein [Nocardiopsis synnemataformans]|uniref:hypothetical protein n=1 Tax=Nocardiopsis synnemataformans TaxID=61305 RepID=UPI003EB9EEC4